jgi:hypothetical protein
MKKNNFRFEAKQVALIALWFCISPGIVCAQKSVGDERAAASPALNTAASGLVSPQAPVAVAANSSDKGSATGVPAVAGSPSDNRPTASQPANTQPTSTDIERQLLEKIEELESRVAELEARGNRSAPSATASAPLTANSAAPATPAAASVTAVAGGRAQTGDTSKAGQTKAPTEEPFSDADWTWLNGNPRTKEIYWDTKFFTPEIRSDVVGVYDFNKPADHSIGGSSEIFRSQEIQLTQLGVGGDFHYDNVRARLMTQFGEYSVTTPRNDASPAHGQWDLTNAYRDLAEAWGGYHWDVLNGVNVDAGIFLSYIGLFSYYQFDNWAYQPSFVSSNTPWFFEGVRVQIFPTKHLKIEPWFINGWQSYASANHTPGVGGQIKCNPKPCLNIISNN